MPIVNGKYVNPGWNDNTQPAINAVELNAISDTLENGIPGAANRIGDVIFTERTDLGSSWLLCNGEQVNKSQYQELWGLCERENTSSTPTQYSVPKISGYRTLSDGLFYANGYYGYLFIMDVAGGTYNAKFAYSTSINGPWNTVDIFVGIQETVSPTMYSCNNVFVMATRISGYIHIFYSSNPSNGFIDVDLSNESFGGKGMTSVLNIMYSAGKYYIAYSYNNGSYNMYDGIYSNSLSSGWLFDNINSTVNLYSFYLHNNKLYYIRNSSGDSVLWERTIGVGGNIDIFGGPGTRFIGYRFIRDVLYIVTLGSYPNVFHVNYGITKDEIEKTIIFVTVPEIMNNKDMNYSGLIEYDGMYFSTPQYVYNPTLYSYDMKSWSSSGNNFGQFHNCNKYMYNTHSDFVDVIDMEQHVLPLVNGEKLYPMIKAK